MIPISRTPSFPSTQPGSSTAGVPVRLGTMLTFFALLAVGRAAPAAQAQVTIRAALDGSGDEVFFPSQYPEVSPGGRFVVFNTSAPLVAGDTNLIDDVYLRDCVLGTTERISVSTSGAQTDDYSYPGCVTTDGRFVVFGSYATNLVAGDTNAAVDVFLRDRLLSTTERINVSTGGVQGNNNSNDWMAISDDGRYVFFGSLASSLVPGDTNGGWDVFVRDRQIGTTERVSVQTGGAQAQGGSVAASASPDGRFVVFLSYASDLVAGDTNNMGDIFVRDRVLGTTERASVGPGGLQGNGYSETRPSISDDGRYVAFESTATNLVAGDTNFTFDVFVRDRQLGQTTRVSVATGGAEANGESPYGRISGDGSIVTIHSWASNLAPGDTNAVQDVFVHDRLAATTERISVSPAGAQANGLSILPVPSRDGRFVAFWSSASNLVDDDTNGFAEPFLRDRAASSFTSHCDPGSAGVIACPCANPPSGPGRGCDNSAATGGAVLSASGAAYLATDSLVLTSAGELPSATSIFLQGSSAAPAGIVFGQGVRCVGGSLKRLFVKNASGGSISAPDLLGGDPSISVRSGQLGSTILPGESRWYLVYYRDPNLLGGCPAGSTFNATQTGLVTWSF